MNRLIQISITSMLSCAAAYWLAWWMIAVIPFVVAIVSKQTPGNGFVNGFTAVGVLWSMLVLLIDYKNGHMLSANLAELFKLSQSVFIIANILLGAIIGGLGGWSGACMYNAFKSQGQT